MEQKITSPQKEVHEETPHLGRNISIALTLVAIVFGVWFVALGRWSGMGSVTMDTSLAQKGEEVSLRPEVKPPTEEFVVADVSESVGSQTENIATADTAIFKEPENFKSFDYDAKAGKIISLSGNCHDTYYTVLVFSSAVDYRKDPTAALSNRAFECPSSKLFNVEMNLKDINLQSGKYYVFVADQGKTGSWYNPR